MRLRLFRSCLFSFSLASSPLSLPPSLNHTLLSQSSWVHLGFPSSCLSEGRFEDSNTHMHSSSDTMDLEEFSWEHMRQFVRVGVAVGVELGDMERE